MQDNPGPSRSQNISRDGHDLVEQHEYSCTGRALYGVLTESAMTSEAGRDVSIARGNVSLSRKKGTGCALR